MSRKLKILGPVLVAAFALSAATAQAEVSSSATFATGVGPSFDAEQVGETLNQFEIKPIGPITCESVTMTGAGVVEGSTIEEITLEPQFQSCHAIAPGGITKTATFTVNECAFVFTATTTETKGLKAFTAHTDIECPEGKKIEIHIYNSATEHTPVLCTYAIKPQENLTEITLTNNEEAIPSDLDLDFNVKSIAVERVTGSALTCGAVNNTATYTGTQTLRATAEYLPLSVEG